MSDAVFLDTNILVYAFDTRDAQKQDRALTLLSEPSLPFIISTQVLGEFYVTVTRKLPQALSPQIAAAAVEQLSLFSVVGVDAGLVTAAIATSRTSQLSYWDALIIETAALAQCDRIFTEDLADGATVRGVRIENPFR